MNSQNIKEHTFYNFCTLFDANYLSRGLAMYESLQANCPRFHLYIFPFDELTLSILSKLELKNVTLIPQVEFEDEQLIRLKIERSRGEYCWTCTPSVIAYVLKRFGVDSCTYVDADLYFYSDPVVLFNELADRSVLITEHRYTPVYDRSREFGRFCVQFITFRNNPDGLTVLNWWQEACIRWCYARVEDGKFGDQKYLDDWQSRFHGVYSLRHPGGGLAPWNIQQADVFTQSGRIYLIWQNKEYSLVFYHYHHLIFYDNNDISLGGYKLTDNQIQLLYKPYIRHLEDIKSRLLTVSSLFDPHGSKKTQQDWLSRIFPWKKPFKWCKNRIKRFLSLEFNIYSLKHFQ